MFITVECDSDWNFEINIHSSPESNWQFCWQYYLQTRMFLGQGCTSPVLGKYGVSLEKTLEMPLAYYFHLSRQEQNDYFWWDVLFVIFPKSQIILFNNS